MNICRPAVPPALALAAALGLPLASAPAAGADPLSAFQPTQVRAISVTPADAKAMRALPPLEAFGTIRGTRSPGLDEVGSAAEAAQDAGYALRLPPAVPASLGKAVHYQVTSARGPRSRSTRRWRRAGRATTRSRCARCRAA